MDSQKKIVVRMSLTVLLLISYLLPIYSQEVEQVQFCDRKYEYKEGKDSITLFINLLDSRGKRVKDAPIEAVRKYLVIKEDEQFIPAKRTRLSIVDSGERIPSDYTFSVLVDLSIPPEGKEQIYSAIERLVRSASDSCVYISFFGDSVSSTSAVTRKNYESLKPRFLSYSKSKVFYSALYAKLLEFSTRPGTYETAVKAAEGYRKEPNIARRAALNRDKNVLVVFTAGTMRPDAEAITFYEIVDHQTDSLHPVPKVMALYYTAADENLDIESTLKGICTPMSQDGKPMTDRTGRYLPANNIGAILRNFEDVVNDAMYDYAFSYKVPESTVYSKIVTYTAEWKGSYVGECEYSIGTAERPWPVRSENAADTLVKILYALFVTLLCLIGFFIVIKVGIPYVRTKLFALKYYKRYEAEANVQKRICHYCKQEIQPGQYIVTKCKHLMHVHCWQQNGYKCAEYGQNCKTGIQNHVEWRDLFTLASLKDCYQTFSGIIAGFISWMLYELGGRGIFDSWAAGIVDLFLSSEKHQNSLVMDCVNKTSAFLTIGLLLGLILSLIFRYNDEYRKKDWKISLRILGLSALTGIIGMASFAIGANIMCLLLSITGTTYIPWYCSLPGYLLFSICVSLALTIKSTIPLRSAMIGGICSAIIGFITLYCSGETDNSRGWMHMLLNFVIFGGGLGASLVTVRMLAEKYYLVIQNGIRAGQRIPIHKWMSATGGGNKVSLGMTGECEIQMNWEKSNKVAKEHAQLFIDHDKQLPMLKPLATGVIFNTRIELPVRRPIVLSNGDTFKIGDTIFQYVETE